MTQAAVLAMFLRAAYLPMEYIALSRGNPRAYFIQEAFSAVLLVLFIILGYNNFGLRGIGIFMVLSAMVETLFVIIYTRLKYSYRLSTSAMKYFTFQFLIGLFAYASTYIVSVPFYWCMGIFWIAISSYYSFKIVRGKTKLQDGVKNKFISMFNKQEDN